MAQGKQCVCLRDYEEAARDILDASSWGFFEGGAEREVTVADNVAAFSRYRLLPRVLREVSTVDMTTTILGHPVAFPVGIAPTGMQKIAHPHGELATIRAAGKAQTVFTLSTYATSSIEEVAGAAADTVRFFQVYIPRDQGRAVTEKLIRRAELAGFTAIVVTVDRPVIGVRYANNRHQFKMAPHLRITNLEDELGDKKLNVIENFEVDSSVTWPVIDWLKSVTNLPIMLKGILSPADAALAADHGVAAVWVSNHGGRQLDTVPATIDVLEPIVRAVAGRCEVYLDGGIRCGTDVFKALALGANAVFIGRPVIYGLAYDGMAGVQQVFEIIKDEFHTAMALSGCSTIAEINRNFVVHETEYLSKL